MCQSMYHPRIFLEELKRTMKKSVRMASVEVEI
jgi:hypothetical protein